MSKLSHYSGIFRYYDLIRSILRDLHQHVKNNPYGRMRAMKRWQFWFGLAISALFLYLVLRKIDFPQLWLVLIAGELLVADTRCGSIFCRLMGPLLALALPPASA